MENTDKNLHEKYKFGIFYPNNIHGIGSPSDLLAFFEAMNVVTNTPESDYPLLCSLYRAPVFGEKMLQLSEESCALRVQFSEAKATEEVLTLLKIRERKTELNACSKTLAGVFELVLEILADRVSGFINAASEYPELNILETGSVRLGPIEPLIPSRLFQELPASAFDDNDPPLWLRDEIFDEAFYRGKI